MNRQHIKAMLPIFEAFAAGQQVQFCGNSIEDHDFQAAHYLYRVIPNQSLVPMEPHDVPPGSALREKYEAHWSMITECCEERICTADDDMTWQQLFDEQYLIKRPGEDWQPCHKPAPDC